MKTLSKWAQLALEKLIFVENAKRDINLLKPLNVKTSKQVLVG